MWQKLKNYYHLLQSFTAAVYYNFPSKGMIVIGVTGTDGKTTTVNMIYHVLKSLNKRVSMISTVNAQIGSKKYDTGFHVTTPSPWQVQKYLKKAKDAGSQYFIVESTSHALDQNRLAFISFKVSALTNITHDHLDYHKTWQNYAKSKLKLLNSSEIAILNKDDKSYAFLKDKVKGKIYTYSKEPDSDYSLKNLKINLKIPGNYNLQNALATVAVADILKIPKSQAIKSLQAFKGIFGRMEEIKENQNFRVFIDFAHTPNSLKNALESLVSVKSDQSKIIIVFGSAGNRDKLKRPKMGKIASNLANTVILTAEDPRSENVEDICQEIAKGMQNKKLGKDYYIISDRKKAIRAAIKKAKKGDIVAFFGKGHEKTMAIGKKEYPWDEYKEVKMAIKKNL